MVSILAIPLRPILDIPVCIIYYGFLVAKSGVEGVSYVCDPILIKVLLIGRKKLVDILESKSNVEFILEATVAELQGENELSGVKLNTKDGEKEISLNGLFVAIGLEPKNSAFADVTNLDSNGYFDSDESCVTKTAGIFVAGDCRTKKIRQVATAAADGAIAALAACDYLDK
mgnify:CR=1 FL=1